MKKTVLLSIIFLVALLLRLYKVDNPIADWHSWRQADTSAVTRNFISLGFNPFMPRYDDLSNIQTGHHNPMGYRFVEFPVYNTVSYFLVTITNGLFTIEIWQRLVSIVASLLSMYFIFKLTMRFASWWAGFWAAFFFGILPYSVFYSRVILPEPFMVMLSLGALYAFVLWIDKPRHVGWLFLSSILAAFAILAKPFAVFFFPPLLYLVLTRVKPTPKNWAMLFVYGTIVFVPFGIWRTYIQQFPEGLPAWKWLINSGQMDYRCSLTACDAWKWIYDPAGIRFKGAFFHWLFAVRIGKLILGYFGTFFLLLGILADTKKKENLFFHILGLSMLGYLFVIAGGNVQHDYYQVLLVPIITMYMGRAMDFLIVHSNTFFKPYMVAGVSIAAVVCIFAFSWYDIRGFYWINNPIIVAAGKKANELLPKDAKVIAPYSGDTAFLYQTGRQGWPQGFEIEDKIKRGATHYVSVTPDDAEVTYVKTNRQVLYEGDGFIIIKLQ